jgi:hypothetical protein
MHKPNKIPGMKVKGIDRKRDRTTVYKKHNKARLAEAARLAKKDREDQRRNKNAQDKNKRNGEGY